VSCSYRIKSIDFTDSGIKVNFVPNADSLEVEISKEHTEQFFDILRKNKYNSDRLYLNTVFKKYGNSRDALAINVPNESGCGTSPSDWIDCKFCDSDSQHSKEIASTTNTSIELGMYNEKPLYWTKIGEFECGDVYLCDSIIETRIFDEMSNDYSKSEIRRFCTSIYNTAFSYAEKYMMTSHPLLKDFIFLLSEDEYLKYDLNIKNIGRLWWLRSQSGYASYAKLVYYDGSVSGGFYVSNDAVGVRPAIILKRSFE
jgi:hypothetical protein